MTERSSTGASVSRRQMLTGTALLLATATATRAETILGGLPWTPNAGNPPVPAKAGPWQFFSVEEGRAVEAIADRIIPPDAETPGGKDSGCAVFLDRQLAGPYGRQDGLYVSAPFEEGAKNQGRSPQPVRRSSIALRSQRSIRPAGPDTRARGSLSLP